MPGDQHARGDPVELRRRFQRPPPLGASHVPPDTWPLGVWTYLCQSQCLDLIATGSVRRLRVLRKGGEGPGDHILYNGI